LLTEAEAADRLRVCTRTLRKARHAGLLHYVLIGRAIRYTLGDLESYIELLRQVQPACPPKEPTRRISQPSRKGGEIVPFTQRNALR
jgi:hypothetical protein